MPSNSQRGAYYKRRTKQWFQDRGWEVAHMEEIYWIYRDGERIPRKRDQLGSDLLICNDDEVALVQVKLNRKNVAAAVREFRQFKFPPHLKRWIVVWTPRSRQPDIVDAATYKLGQRRPKTTLF